MRKSRIKFAAVDKSLLDGLSTHPEMFFEHLEELSIKVPTWSKLLLVLLTPSKSTMEVAFFEEAKDFFLAYTKKVLRYSSKGVKFICFSSELSEEWKMFIPPTLIGTNLKTKLRKRL